MQRIWIIVNCFAGVHAIFSRFTHRHTIICSERLPQFIPFGVQVNFCLTWNECTKRTFNLLGAHTHPYNQVNATSERMRHTHTNINNDKSIFQKQQQQQQHEHVHKAFLSLIAFFSPELATLCSPIHRNRWFSCARKRKRKSETQKVDSHFKEHFYFIHIFWIENRKYCRWLVAIPPSIEVNGNYWWTVVCYWCYCCCCC